MRVVAIDLWVEAFSVISVSVTIGLESDEMPGTDTIVIIPYTQDPEETIGHIYNPQPPHSAQAQNLKHH
jgi:hypothetical protein